MLVRLYRPVWCMHDKPSDHWTNTFSKVVLGQRNERTKNKVEAFRRIAVIIADKSKIERRLNFWFGWIWHTKGFWLQISMVDSVDDDIISFDEIDGALATSFDGTQFIIEPDWRYQPQLGCRPNCRKMPIFAYAKRGNLGVYFAFPPNPPTVLCLFDYLGFLWLDFFDFLEFLVMSLRHMLWTV